MYIEHIYSASLFKAGLLLVHVMVETATLDWSVIHRPVLGGPHSHGDLDLKDWYMQNLYMPD